MPYKRTQAGRAAAAAPRPRRRRGDRPHRVPHVRQPDKAGERHPALRRPGVRSAFHMQCLPTPLDLVVKAAAAAAARPARPHPVPCARPRLSARALATQPFGDWFCPKCMPDDAAGVALTKVSSPFSKERGLDRERQVVRGVDLGAWSRDEAARPLRPPGGAPPPWEVASDLLGRACLYAEKEGAPPRAGVVVDARHAEPQRAAGALCVQIALAGRTTAVWVAVAPPNTAVARVWVGGGLCHAPRAAAGVPWPARTFHLLTPLPAAGAPSSSAAAAVAEAAIAKSPIKPKAGKGVSPLAKGSGGGSGGKASGGKGAAPAPGGALLVKFFGVPEGESVEAATPARSRRSSRRSTRRSLTCRRRSGCTPPSMPSTGSAATHATMAAPAAAAARARRRRRSLRWRRWSLSSAVPSRCCGRRSPHGTRRSCVPTTLSTASTS